MIRPTLLCAAALALFIARPAPADARPLDLRRIPAAAQGVGHLDVDALRKTALYRMVKAKVTSGPDKLDIDPKLRPLVDALMRSTHGVSFWVAGNDTGAVLVEVSGAAAISALLDKIPHKTTRVAGHPVRTFREGGEDAMVALVGDVLIAADDARSLERSIKVVTGKAASLKRGALPAAPGGRGLFFFAALGDRLLDKVKKEASSTTLQVDMTTLTMDLAEVGGDVRARVIAVMTSAEAAQKVKSVVDGLLALTALADDEDVKKVRPLLQKIKVTAAGPRLEVSLAIPPAKLIELVESQR